MKFHGMMLSVIVGVALLAGCKNEPQASLRNQRDLHGRYAMDDAPPLVQSGFRRDYPNIQPTSMQLVHPATGAPMYKFIFVLNGRPYDATYDHDGNLVVPALLPQDARNAAAQLQQNPQPAAAQLGGTPSAGPGE
jgi:hypothetical protein